ncbi:bifunctional 2-polyprenyl-6-hydroxyphenol methylase/3-demethylubiquinol 3-O-methyltransferase UbiG [Formicincola oecophyllae]|uniref:Ubiquinone biosynthesis O-methyltransferase n=1 Tax=Formicincola oecophyllae TaxID=2558361 RepID=A0A4Y6U700_9PROT|nr:bifunctional 2-polyprenyl-6-hydroxyphenol methylase/3-demethylubiquinol 3-O-methyltransferase UbiG [Formicincola oecophyllae]QDH12944.1 bifunctional 2-polyprenyl-6-hydroxyphenol methylase/3-demethylubiquinol 3-O-methyltransferase UbiG [Formicincola oecophyllae]
MPPSQHAHQGGGHHGSSQGGAPRARHASSINAEEIAHFDALADEWWNPKGPMAPLHAMNPARTDWVKAQVEKHLKPAPSQEQGGQCLHLLDMGCGAGLASERYARLGFDTLGCDASPSALAAARAHLASHPLGRGAGTLHYHHGSAEELAAAGKTFDVVSALEIVEHVNNPAQFIKNLAALVRPGGCVALSTLNRTVKSFLVAKVGAEYVLRMVEKGTHDWRKFITPAELEAMGTQAGLRLVAMSGLNPHGSSWRAGGGVDVNYITLFQKPAP